MDVDDGLAGVETDVAVVVGVVSVKGAADGDAAAAVAAGGAHRRNCAHRAFPSADHRM